MLSVFRAEQAKPKIVKPYDMMMIVLSADRHRIDNRLNFFLNYHEC